MLYFHSVVTGVGGGGGQRVSYIKWPLVRGKFRLWNPKKVAAGRVRGVVFGEG